jgi:hypothetical protein
MQIIYEFKGNMGIELISRPFPLIEN